MNSTTLGNLVDATAQRDAIHIAVAPVTAAKRLRPGQHVGFVSESTEVVGVSWPTIGIVDPFLTKDVKKGERFMMLLYPQSITSLRHEWTHPAFGAEVAAVKDVAASKAFVTSMAEALGIGYDEMMAGAKNFVESNGNDVIHMGAECNFDAEFWDHYEAITGTKVPEDMRYTFFSCSC